MESDPFTEIKAAILGGQKILAIKLYRELHRVGLAEAKEAIDHLEDDLRTQSVENLDLAKYQPAQHQSLSGTRLAAIQAELFAGNKIAAIKLYRELNPVGLAEAKEIIDKMEADLRVQASGLFSAPPSNPAAGCFILLIVVIGLGYGIWRMMH